jgi:hypothetical protein
MQTPETPNEVINERVGTTVETEKELLELAQANPSRAEALRTLATIENQTPEKLLERIQSVAASQREAKENNQPFMAAYTEQVRTEAAQYNANPSEYAALRSKADISVESLG